MSKIDDAADQVLGLAERFRGLLDLAEVVKSIGSLDQAIAERQAALDTISGQHESAKAELASTQANIAGLQQTLSDKLAQHQKDCDALSDAATADAANIRAQAQSNAAALMTTTQAQLVDIQKTHDDLIAEKRAELADLGSQIDNAKQALADITAVHETTAARVDALRAAAKSVLGG